MNRDFFIVVQSPSGILYFNLFAELTLEDRGRRSEETDGEMTLFDNYFQIS